MRRPPAALVLSSAALFVALGGPAAAQDAAKKISGARLIGNTVSGSKIRDGSVTATDLSARTRRALRTPLNRSVTAAKLRANAVRSTAIAPGAIGASRLGVGAVSSTAVADGSLRARDLGRHQGHVQLDFGPIAAGACQALPVGLSRAAEDAVALVTAPANWPVPIQVTAVLGPSDRSISVLACNFTGAPADPGPVAFRYLVIEFS